MIRFVALSWIIFVPAIIALAMWLPSLRRPLRLTCLTLLTLILLQPQMRRLGPGLDLWVLVDRSASAADALAPRRSEIEGLLTRSKSAEDRIFFVDYAELAQRRGDADEIPPHKQQQTRTRLAIEFALSHLSPDRAARLLLLSDGYTTEPLQDIGERLAREDVALDYRLLSQPGVTDYRVGRLEIPARAQVGEPFLLEIDVTGEPDGPVSLTIERDGASIGSTELQVRSGKATGRFTDRLTKTGAHRYVARVSGEGDVRPDNNHIERWLEIAGGPRILLLSSYADDPLGAALSALGFQVDTISDPATAHVGQLSGAKAVLLNNLPASRLPAEFLAALDFYVRSQGGGLLMAGGKSSFASGGYFDSAIDDLLPVSMELRTEHRKLAVAMAIVLDRSGSMSAAVAGNLQKMDLANEGAARAIELLGPMDAVSVFAVDVQAHEIVPLTGLSANRKALVDMVRRIASGGGGICVPTGLRAARSQLLKAPAGQRHILLFADANDATQELADWATLREMTKEGITISVIALGGENDSGAEFLRNVADVGKGRIFFNANPSELPALFAQETVAVARSAFIDSPVPVTPTAGWLELAAKPLDWLAEVDGYNLSYLKPEATAAAFSGDEYQAPLVAYWQRGAGRVGAVSFPLGGEFSDRVRSWERYGDFVQTLARWLAGEQLPPGIGLRTRLQGTELQVDLLYDESWEEKLTQSAPRVVLGEGDSARTRELVWQRLAPGHYTTVAPLPPEQWVRGAVQVERFTLPFGPLVVGSNAEWQFDRARVAELEAVAKASGGTERIDLAKVWQAPRRSAFRDLRPWMLTGFLLLFLLDAFLTRRGWSRQTSSRDAGAGVDDPDRESAAPVRKQPASTIRATANR